MAFFEEDKQQFEKDDRFALDLDEVKASLEKVRKSGSTWWKARCPAHADGNPSLVFTQNGNTVGFHCFAGCSYESIVRSLGMWKDSPKKKERIKGRIVKTYDYKDENGVLKYQVVRYEPKAFRQRRPDGVDNWIWNLEGVQRLLYKLPELVASSKSLEPVFIVEGERDVDNLIAAGGIATTNSGGGAKWERHFNKYFAGRDVIIIADNDVTGFDHVEKVSKEVYRSAKSVKIVFLPSKENKYDVSNYLEDGNTYDDLLYLCRETDPVVYTEEDLTVDLTQSHNLEAEMAVLGAIFKNQILIGRVIEYDVHKHFFDKKTKATLGAMIECFEASSDINYITVADKFDKQSLARIGGSDYFKSLERDLPEVFDIDSWIKIIIAKSQYRDLVKLGQSVTKVAEHEAQGVEYLADDILDKVYNIKSEDKRGGFDLLGNGLEGVIVEAREAVGLGITGVPTGFVDLDGLMGGLQDTDLIIVAGRPSMGKTSFAMNIAAHAAIREARNVGIFSLEMSKKQLIAKVLCSEAYVNSRHFKTGLMQERDWAKIVEVLPALSEANIFIDETPSISFNEIRSKALRLQQEKGLDLLIVDYVQLMSGGKGYNRQEQVADISRRFKGLAKELGIPIILVSQLNRGPEGRSDPRPMMSDLRESGSLEQDADVIIFAFREEYYNPDKDDCKGLAEMIVAKNRQGATDKVQLAWLKQYTKFMNLIQRY